MTDAWAGGPSGPEQRRQQAETQQAPATDPAHALVHDLGATYGYAPILALASIGAYVLFTHKAAGWLTRLGKK